MSDMRIAALNGNHPTFDELVEIIDELQREAMLQARRSGRASRCNLNPNTVLNESVERMTCDFEPNTKKVHT